MFEILTGSRKKLISKSSSKVIKIKYNRIQYDENEKFTILSIIPSHKKVF